MKKKRPSAGATTVVAIIFASWWSFYFIAVVLLEFFHYISFAALSTTLLAFFALTPLPKRTERFHYLLIFRQILGLLASIILFWHESRLPSFQVMLSLITNPEMRFSSEFILNFLWQSFSFIGFGIFLVIVAISVIIARSSYKKYIPLLVTVGIIVASSHHYASNTRHESVVLVLESDSATSSLEGSAPFTPTQNPPPRPFTLDEQVARFYAQEANRYHSFTFERTPDTDIIILQICSFGWEDFMTANVDMRPFFSQFDVIFTRFNSADSYSHTAGIRLLRGLCGQTPHEALFTDAAPGCYPLTAWRNAGYHTFTAFNHNGVYSDFSTIVERSGKADVPLPITDLTAPRIGFDSSPIYSDYDVLSRWLHGYVASSSGPVALYYNTISLHAGVHAPDKDWWKKTNEKLFTEHVATITTDLTHFFNDLKISGRKAIVVVVAEHGAALKKTGLQPQTVREIPLPGITIVPAAFKIFGPGFNDRVAGAQVYSNEPVSYLGLYTTLDRIISSDLQSADRTALLKSIENLPLSDFVASSWNGIVVERPRGFYYKRNGGDWELLPESIVIPTTKTSLP